MSEPSSMAGGSPCSEGVIHTTPQTFTHHSDCPVYHIKTTPQITIAETVRIVNMRSRLPAPQPEQGYLRRRWTAEFAKGVRLTHFHCSKQIPGLYLEITGVTGTVSGKIDATVRGRAQRENIGAPSGRSGQPKARRRMPLLVATAAAYALLNVSTADKDHPLDPRPIDEFILAEPSGKSFAPSQQQPHPASIGAKGGTNGQRIPTPERHRERDCLQRVVHVRPTSPDRLSCSEQGRKRRQYRRRDLRRMKGAQRLATPGWPGES